MKHWHGGTESQTMKHFAVSTDHEKNPSKWFEAVGNEEFKLHITKN